MNKKVIASALLFILIASTIGLNLVSVANANFTPAPNPAITDKPIITLLSPQNGTSHQNDTTIIFNVAMPPSWDWPYTKVGGISGVFEVGTIWNVTCSLDQEQILFNDTIYGRDANPYTNPDNFYAKSINYVKDVGELSSRQHNLTISVGADTFWSPTSVGNVPSYYDVSTSVSYFFKTTPPAIDLSLTNRTYNKPVVPVVFNLNDSTSWMGFSLDNRANVTIVGNVTLTNLTEGNHSLVVYANDTFGNMGKSDIILFNIVLPTPSPSPQPTLSASPSVPEFPTWIILPIVATATLLTALFIRKKTEAK